QESFTRLRLGSLFSMACARSTEDVNSFYSSGAYTIEACFRSCYQDMAQKLCGCMDPRYNMPANARKCDLEKFDCCESIVRLHVDISSWKNCFCPPPCDERQFSVIMTSRAIADDCANFSENETCVNNLLESEIEVVLSHSSHIIYIENPAFPLMKVIVNMGGYGGLLCGFCIIVFCELITLLWIIYTSVCKK
ncbi:hypothetical protein PMAYCL1PPCAC_29713, partial [Pristionchus mayeri]